LTRVIGGGFIGELIVIHTQTHEPHKTKHQIPGAKHQQTQCQQGTRADTGTLDTIPDKQATPNQTKTIKASHSIGLEPIL
jgi:hypothetical protein